MTIEPQPGFPAPGTNSFLPMEEKRAKASFVVPQVARSEQQRVKEPAEQAHLYGERSCNKRDVVAN